MPSSNRRHMFYEKVSSVMSSDSLASPSSFHHIARILLPKSAWISKNFQNNRRNIAIAKSSAEGGFICLFFVLVLISLLNHSSSRHLHGHFCSITFSHRGLLLLNCTWPKLFHTRCIAGHVTKLDFYPHR